MARDNSHYDRASIFSRITYQWIAPTIHKANRPAPEGEDTLGEHDAEAIISSRFAAPVVAERFARLYIPGPGEDQEPTSRRWWPFRRVRTHGSIFWSLVICHAPSLAFQSGLVLLVTAMRLVSPIALRSYLSWLTAYESANPEPVWKGYLLAVSLGACALGVTVVQHQQPWYGNLLGFLMRQQAIAAIHAKLLLLNAAAVSAISPGFIINLVSNDVRRFDDAAFYWLYAWEAPLELGMVLLMVSLELDFLSALAGISATLALVPMQAFLVRPMASIRRSSAQATDARVRLASEAIQGALACKVLGWEEPLAQELRALRVKEAKHVGAMTRIRATNMALQFVITVLVTFCTFAVYMSRNGTLNVSSVFYAVALLQLPRRSMWSFVQAVQVLTELRVSIQRIQLFLTSPEPPRETHSTGSLSPPSPTKEVLPHTASGGPQSYPSQSVAAPSTTNSKSVQNGLAVMLKGGDNHSMVSKTAVTAEPSGELPSVLEVANGGEVSGSNQQFKGGSQRVGGGHAMPVTSLRDAQGPLPKGTVALSGASYDWDRPFGSQGPMQSYGLGALDGSVRAGEKKTPGSTISVAHGPATAPNGMSNSGPAPASKSSANAQNGRLEHQAVALTQTGLAEPSSGTQDNVKHQSGHAEPRDEHRLTLSGIRLVLRPGELLGVCGEVGSGKSSLLAALLGELQPLDATTAAAATQADLKPAVSVIVDGDTHAAVSAAAAGTATEVSMIASKFIERDTARIKPGESQVIHAAGAQQEAQQQQQQQAGMLMPQGTGHAALCSDGLSAAGPAWEEQVLTYMDQAGLGSATIVGSLAYCAQVPWVVAGTFRDNILFGSPNRPSWYRQVLRACALEEDVAALPGGDMTELGERGINLSGGQKARLALARAAYQQPDVALLDDPLSAVDPRVGRTLFRECIGPRGTMKGTTRVLATHQRQYLPLCDRVLVIRGGRAVALASWPELVKLNLPEIASAVGGGLSLEDPDDPDEDQSATDRNSDDKLGGHEGEEADPTLQPFKAQVNPLWHDSWNSPGVTQTIHEATTDSQDPPSSKDLPNKPSHGVLTSSRTMVPGDRPALAPARSWRHAPLAWAKSFGPHAGAAMGGAALIGTSFRRVFSSRRFREEDVAGGDASVVKKPSAAQPGLDQGQLVRAEGRAVGTVSWGVYLKYFRQMGVVPMVLLPLVILGAQAAYIASEWWLSLWARAAPADQHDAEWLWVYGMLAGIVVVLGCWRAFMFFDASLRASTRVHDSMVACVLRAPLSFFHTNPAGRVLNRFSKDQGTVDDQLPTVMFDAIQCGLLVLGAVVLIAAAVPLVLPVFLPLGFIFMWIRTRYIAASREIKRWEAVTRSPVYATFSSTLKGLATIRAYGAQARFHKELLQQLTANGCWSFAFSATGRWIGFRLDLVAATTMLAAALIAVAMRNSVSPGLLGLALTNLLSMTGIMQWFIRQSAEVENNMTCTERMLEYTALPQEPPRVKDGGPAPPPGWPTSGALTWEGVSSRYRPELPLVLQDVSFSLKPNTVCGVVGRTGSGKSSLALTLFRLIEVTGGRVVLDGVDVATIGIDALRNQLAIIPQDPVLFSGTVRSNLDPWGRYADAALWEVLASVQMRRAVSDLGGLSARLAEAGDNLSVGQRQLFCLARALLQDARVLVLDEATANVDRETDALIHTALDTHVRPQHQQHTAGAPEPSNGTAALLHPGKTLDVSTPPASVHKQSPDTPAPTSGKLHGGLTAGLAHSGRVLLVIAHRIDTIMDSDHLLVLGAGKLQEQGAPHDLAAREGGVFAGMVSAARLTAAVHAAEEPSGPSE